VKITNATTKTLPVPPTGNKVRYDNDLPGFGVRVTAAGARAYVLTFRVKSTQRQRTMTIGRCDVWAESAARKEAKRLRQLVDQGGDPLGDIESERAAPDVNELADRFLSEYLPKVRAMTAKSYKGHIRRHIRPVFGNRKVADISFTDVDRLHRRLTDECGPIAANRTMATMTVMFSQAIKWQMRSDNPCAGGIGKNKENKRKRYLRDDELPRLLSALADYRNQRIANAIRMMLMTGARSGEVLAMEWKDLNLADGTWLKSADKVKQGDDHDVPLAAPARQLLAEILAEQKKHGVATPFVFPTRLGRSTNHADMWKAFQEITRAAGIKGLRPHDLRHNYASVLASGGASLPMIGALLGHKNPATTARYAHLSGRRSSGSARSSPTPARK
jgi:integrase